MANGSKVNLSDIGQGNNALLFRTDFTNCCQSQMIGKCYKPNRDEVGVRAAGDQLFRNRGNQLVRLNRQSGNPMESGVYCCEVPKSATEVYRICVDIFVEA